MGDCPAAGHFARIAAAGITWPLPVAVTDEELERRLFPNGGVRARARHYAEPDWAVVARELKRPGVNLMILCEKYRAVHADSYAYKRRSVLEISARSCLPGSFEQSGKVAEQEQNL